MNCPLLDVKTCCGFAGLPEGCPLRAAKCPIAVPVPNFGSFTDPRDGRTYKTVKIGEQVWLAENLAFDYAGSKVYDNKLANLAKYGRLYDWETAKKAVPQGWHLPSREEWQTLVDFAGSDKVAGKNLKATSGWNSGGNGTDAFGFAALPGGIGNSNGDFGNVGDNGNWWSSSEYNGDYAYYRYMNYEYVHWNDIGKSFLFSVRCVQDCKGEGI